MFDELTVKRNKDHTYAMHVTGLSSEGFNGKNELVIHKMLDFPLNIELSPIGELEFFPRRAQCLPIQGKWNLTIETELFPNKKGEVAQIRTKSKVRRIHSLR